MLQEPVSQRLSAAHLTPALVREAIGDKNSAQDCPQLFNG